jgi:hypothetical protein
MRTCLYAPCWIDGPEGNFGTRPGVGDTRVAYASQSRFRTHVRWLDYYRRFQSQLGYEKIVLVDNASDLRMLQALGGNTFDEQFNLLVPSSGRNYLDIIRFSEHLTRRGALDYPYFWRLIMVSTIIARRFGYQKLIQTVADCYMLTSRMMAYVAALKDGYTSMWCAKYGFPENSLHVLCADSFSIVDSLHGRSYDSFAGVLGETAIPYTRIEKGLVGDRYGEDNLPQHPSMDWYAQWNSEAAPIFDMASQA